MFTFDGKHATQFFDKLIEISRPARANRNARKLKVEDKPGTYFFGVDTDDLPIEVKVAIVGADREDLWRKIRVANAWLITDDLRTLVLDSEPDLSYQAIVTGSFDEDETLNIGIGTFNFTIPDPDAYGETKQQRVTSASAQFIRNSVRNREDGTQVTPNLPVYKDGKFDKAVLIEEGTTNLLASASSPVVETKTVTQGDNYYLTNIGGSTSIEHKKVETIASQQLGRAGTNVTSTKTTTADFTPGTFTNTVATSNQVELGKQGTPFTRTETTTADFNDSGATRTNVTVASNEISLTNYAWDVNDNMSNWVSSWISLNGATTSLISQQSGFARINVTSGQAGETGIALLTTSTEFPTTVVFRAKVNGTVRCRLENGASFVLTNLNTSPTNYAWYWARFVSSSDVILYRDGVLMTAFEQTGASSNFRISFYVPSSSTGTIDIDQVYIDYGADKGVPSGTGDITGTYISKGYDLSSVITAAEQSINWTQVLASVDSTASITVSSQIGTGSPVTWPGTWTTETNGASLASIAVGDSMTGKSIRYKVDFTTKDPGGTVTLQDCTINVDSALVSSGTYVSPEIDISAVNKAIASTISWNWNANTNGSLSASVALSTNGGSSYGSYQSVTNGGSLPGITQTTDLSNARLKFKFDLSTTSNINGPFLLDFTVSLTSGYLTSQSFNITAYNVSDIGVSSGSTITWSATTPTGTGVTMETSRDGTNYTPVSSGGNFLTTNENLTGKSLYIRYTLTTSDISVTPTMNSVTWQIKQAETNKIKPATTTLVLTPSSVSRWQLENRAYGTGWQEYGTPRTAESMYLFANDTLDENQGTIELFVYEEGENYGTRTIFENDDDSYKFSLVRTSTPQYVLKVNNLDQISLTPPSIGWHHLAVVWSSTSIRLYVDGVFKGSVNITLNLGATTNLYFGSSSINTNQWNGLLDDLAIWTIEKDVTYFLSRVTTPAENSDTNVVFPFDNSLSVLEDSNVVIEGTAETNPIFTINLATSSSYFKVSNGIDYVQINYDFEADDVLVIDCEKNLVTINGSTTLGMENLDMDSDFFSISTGQNITAEPAGIATVDVIFKERWL